MIVLFNLILLFCGIGFGLASLLVCVAGFEDFIDYVKISNGEKTIENRKRKKRGKRK